MQLMIGARVDSLEMFMGARVREKYLPRRNIYYAIPLSLSFCIVILDSNFNRSEETFSNVPNLSFQEEFFSQYYTEYIPNLSRSSFHFRLISSINARVTRDNNNIQHVLRDANVTAPSFSLSLSLSPAWPSPECARYICPRWHFQSRRILEENILVEATAL